MQPAGFQVTDKAHNLNSVTSRAYICVGLPVEEGWDRERDKGTSMEEQKVKKNEMKGQGEKREEEEMETRESNSHTNIKFKKKINSVALVREQTIPTERPPLVGQVTANFCG
jgi:hypothetical protein